MAGSGDLLTLKILRKIRNVRRPDTITASTSTTTMPSIREAQIHSLHVSTNMAIGLLCLGNGRLIVK